MKFGPKYKWFEISYLELFCLKKLFRAYAFMYTLLCIRFYVYAFRHTLGSEVPVDIISFFLISDFLAEYLKAFLRNSTQLTLKIICSRNIAKNVSDFTNFLANIFLFGVRKNICTAPFLDAQELHSWSTLRTNVFVFLYISLTKFLFLRRSKVLSGGGWGGGEAE